MVTAGTDPKIRANGNGRAALTGLFYMYAMLPKAFGTRTSGGQYGDVIKNKLSIF